MLTSWAGKFSVYNCGVPNLKSTIFLRFSVARNKICTEYVNVNDVNIKYIAIVTGTSNDISLFKT